MILPDLPILCIDSARNFQKKLLSLFNSRSYASLQLVEALAYASHPTTVVELSQELPFQRSYSVINKILGDFGAKSVVTKTISVDGSEKKVQSVDPIAFSNITRPFSRAFFEASPKETKRKFRLFAIDATSNARIHAQTLHDRSYVHQANQIGIPVTVGLEVSVLSYLPEDNIDEANWQLPISLERICTDSTACKIAKLQLQLLSELSKESSLLHVIVADSAYTKLTPYSENQVVITRCRTDRIGRKAAKIDQGTKKKCGRPSKYEPGVIRFIEDRPPGTKGGSDEKSVHDSMIKQQQVDILCNRWNDIYVEGHVDLVDVVKIEIFSKSDYTEIVHEPLLLILSGKKKREVTSLEAYECYQRRFDIEHFFRFVKQKLLFTSYQTPDLDHQISWWWICFMAYWLLYHVRHIAHGSSRPWHKKTESKKPAGPGQVKRLFALQIFPVLGSPTTPPISHKKSKGRVAGINFPKRERKKIVKKDKKSKKAA